MSTLTLTGSVLEAPDGTLARTFDVRLPCRPAPCERVVDLLTDAPVALQLDGLAAINMFYLEASSSVTAALTFGAGSPQQTTGELIAITSRAVPITAISLTRTAGQAATVRLILGQGVSP